MGVGFSNLGKLTETRWRISNLQGSRSYYIVAEKKHIYIYIYMKAKLFSKIQTGNNSRSKITLITCQSKSNISFWEFRNVRGMK